MGTDPLHIQLLGNFHLAQEGRSILSTESASAKALVAFLLLQSGVAQPRQQLAFQLWPDSAEAQAMSNLRALLVRLRRAWPEIERYVEIGPRALGWRDEADFRFDVADFESALLRAEREPDERRAALEQAVNVYRGDLFPSCYQDWILPKRESLRQTFLQALASLIALQEASGQYVVAIGFAQRRLQYDPLDESAYQELMRLHALRGDRAGVLRVLDTCTTTLQRELAVEPGPETRALFERLMHEPPASPPPGAPPARTQHNLSHPLTSFVGRQREMIEIKQRLQTTRLLTLTGVGGSGKTRLALQMAFACVADYPDGVWWVDLAALSDPRTVARTVASILAVQEQPGRSPVETLSGAIGVRQLLLILDNCEHLIAECATLAGVLLSACPNLTLLATSRESLGLTGEGVYAVLPLSLPSEPEPASIEQSDAIQLFVERAALVLPTFTLTPQNQAAVIQVCRRLDGIPLAIELAAARVKLLSVDQIASRLDDRFSLLTSANRAALPRHQTLRALVDWSHDLLSEPERMLFRRLAVFAGGFTLEAADAVCGVEADPSASILETLSRVIDKSLVIAEAEPSTVIRYRLLETIRQYALEELHKAGEAATLQRRHLLYFLSWAEQAEVGLVGATQDTWMPRVVNEHDNFRAALQWAQEQGKIEPGLRLAGSLWSFWYLQGHWREGQRWLEVFLNRRSTTDGANPINAQIRSKALDGLGVLIWRQDDFAHAAEALDQALALKRELGDKPGLAYVLVHRGILFEHQSNARAAQTAYEESLALCREVGDKTGISRALHNLGNLAVTQNDNERATVLYEECLALYQELGGRSDMALLSLGLGAIAQAQRDFARARELFEQSLALSREVGDPWNVAEAQYHLGVMASEQGDYAMANSLLHESLERFETLKELNGAAKALGELGVVARAQGDIALAAPLLKDSLRRHHHIGNQVGVADALERLADIFNLRSRPEEAVHLISAAARLREIAQIPAWSYKQAMIAALTAEIKAKLGEADFEQCWSVGQELSPDQAVDEALAL